MPIKILKVKNGIDNLRLCIFPKSSLYILSAGYIILIIFILSCSDKGTEPDDDNNNYSQADKVYDIDGNEYHTVTIGEQVWMLENLRVTHFNTGEPIPMVPDTNDWTDMDTSACCSYANIDTLADIYGLLYNWYAVADVRKIAPYGWHIPSDDEWKQLELYLGMTQSEVDGTTERGTDQGNQMRETGTLHWKMNNYGATNSSGFTALPGGYRYYYGYYSNLGYLAGWWTTTESNTGNAWARFVSVSYTGVHRFAYYKQFGFSVRCIRDY